MSSFLHDLHIVWEIFCTNMPRKAISWQMPLECKTQVKNLQSLHPGHCCLGTIKIVPSGLAGQYAAHWQPYQFITNIYKNMNLNSGGRLWTAGQNNHGQLSRGTTKRTILTKVTLPGRVEQIAVGNHHCVALTSDGQVRISPMLETLS